MLKNIIVKQNRKSIFGVLKQREPYRCFNTLLEDFNMTLADPHINGKQVAARLKELLKEDRQLINMYDQCFYTPLMNAICHSINYLGTTERIKFLLENGADPNKNSGACYYTPMLLAIKDLPISYSITKTLIKYNCKVDNNAVWHAVMYGDFATLQMLEYHSGTQICNLRDEYGRTVLNCSEIFCRDEDFKYRLHRYYEQQKLNSILKK